MENNNEIPQAQTNYPPQEAVGFPSAGSSRAKSNGHLKWIVIAFVGLLVIGGAAFFVLRGEDTTSATPIPTSALNVISTPNTIQTPQPTSSSVPTNRADVSVQILNGTGIAGEAGYLDEQLKNLGYTDTKTGNASGSTVTVTTMTYNSSVSAAVVSEITQFLEKTYQKVETKMSSSTGSFDVSIVVGLRLGATPKASAAATSTPKATISPSPTPTATP